MIDKNSNEYKKGTRLILLLWTVGILFVILGVHITLLEFMHSEEFAKNSANQRQWKTEDNILRGDFTDRNGTVLAHTEINGDERKRIYDFDDLYAHVIGYSSKIYGKTQLEFTYNKYLADISGFSGVTDIAENFISQKKGDTVKLTIDNELQKKAKKLLGGKNGAVVAIEPNTGEILCLYSNPTFNPDSSSLESNWDYLSGDENSPFVSRATGGLYAPGSIYKTIMLCAALETGYGDFVTDDKGEIVINNFTYKNQGEKAYGEIDLKKAYSVSSNVAFIELGTKLGEDVIKNYSKKFCIGTPDLSFDIPVNYGNFNYESNFTDNDIALVSIGQGETLVTPLQMAVMTCVIANGGNMVSPYLVSEIDNMLGFNVMKKNGDNSKRIISQTTADIVTEYMIETVENGTGSAAKIKGYSVAGKTGTAENEKDGKEHTWFIGFAPADNPEIAVAVLCEYSGGSGGSNCGPIAREIMKMWIEK